MMKIAQLPQVRVPPRLRTAQFGVANQYLPGPGDALEYHGGPRMFQPKGHALPWHGVRVLELSRRTWTAALCGQMMAALGAEVIRVSSSHGGGAHGAPPKEVPRQLHWGKRWAQSIDLENPEDLKRMKSETWMKRGVFFFLFSGAICLAPGLGYTVCCPTDLLIYVG